MAAERGAAAMNPGPFAARCRAVSSFAALLATAGLVLSAPAQADIRVAPFADVRQVVSDSSRNEARGWLELAAGVTARAETNRLDGSFSYRYARRIEEFGDLSQRNRHNASANLAARVIEDFLFLNAGGSATQYASDARGFGGLNTDEDNGNQTQIFSGYVQPRVQQRFGDFATLDAQYRLGAVSADGPRENSQLPGNIGLDPTDGVGALLTDSVTHSGGVTVASTRGTNTINWSLNGTATLEDIDQLDQKYRGYSAGGELGFQLTRKLELIASGGYEDIENTQDSILFDPVTGLPDLDADGNFQIDPAQPRQTAFDFSGEYWNGGFRFVPSRRTTIEIRAGERYGDLNIYADVSYRSRRGLRVRGNFSQTLSSFSRLLGIYQDGELVGGTRIGGAEQFGVPLCVLGVVPGTDESECIGGLTQSITPATFKADRGILQVARSEDALTWSVTGFYEKRRYVDSRQLQSPLTSPVTLFGDDESFGVRGGVTWRLGENENLSVDSLLSRNRFALSLDRKDVRFLLGSSYSRQLNRRLYASASLYGTQRFSNTSRDSRSVTASAGLRYRF
jgi:hypothetical protein